MVSGAKVYSVVAVLSIAGDQVPVTPLFEVVGNTAKTSPLQIAATCVKVGITSLIILTLPVAISLEKLERKTTLMSSRKLPTEVGDAGMTDLKRMV